MADRVEHRHRRWAAGQPGPTEVRVLHEPAHRSGPTVAALISPLDARTADELRAAKPAVERALSPPALREPITLRAHRVGDVGWIVDRQAVLWAHATGWAAGFEAVLAEIGARVPRRFDPACEHGWVAEQGGRVVGAALLVRKSKRVAQLRLLDVDPPARHLHQARGFVLRRQERCRSCGRSLVGQSWTRAL